MLPPICTSLPGRPQDVRGQGRGRRLAVGACDGDERCLRRGLRPLAGVQLHVADDLDPGRPGLAHHPVRLGMRERHARRQHQGGEAAPVGRARGPPRARRSSPPPRGPRHCRRRPRRWRRRPCSARQLASPDRPSPNTATSLPANVVMRIMDAISSWPIAGCRQRSAPGSRRTDRNIKGKTVFPEHRLLPRLAERDASSRGQRQADVARHAGRALLRSSPHVCQPLRDPTTPRAGECCSLQLDQHYEVEPPVVAFALLPQPRTDASRTRLQHLASREFV